MESVSNILSRYSDNPKKQLKIKERIIDYVSSKTDILDLDEPATVELEDNFLEIKMIYPLTYERLSDLNMFVGKISADPEDVLMDFCYCMLVLMVDLENYFCGGIVSL